MVDYAGDGILAMWNAPTAQADHAGRACRAALDMLAELPGLNSRWQAVAAAALAFGIGINTGPAQVGNTGSSRKFKYGPLGNTVNLASRVQGATKHLGLPVLITGATAGEAGRFLRPRRLCQVRVVGIREPVELYELYGGTPPPPNGSRTATATRPRFELFEAGHWLHTCQSLLPLLEQGQASGTHEPRHPQNHEALMGLPRSAAEETFDPVLELTSK